MTTTVNGFLDYLGKIAACSVVLYALAFWAGYVYQYTFLDSLGVGWFATYYNFTDFAMSGAGYAMSLFVGAVLIISVHANRLISETGVIWIIGIVSCALLAGTFSLYYFFTPPGTVLLTWLGEVAATWYTLAALTAVIICLVLMVFQPDINQQPGINMMLVVVVMLTVGFVAWFLPWFSGQSTAYKMSTEQYKRQQSIYKTGTDEKYLLVDVAGGKFLVVDRDGFFTVIEGSAGWRVVAR